MVHESENLFDFLSGTMERVPESLCTIHPVICRCINTSRKENSRLQSPAARNLVHHYGLRVDDIIATGPRDTLLKEDVLKYIKEKNVKPGAQSSGSSSNVPRVSSGIARIRSLKGPRFVDIELTNMRKVIAKRLTLSKSSIPHAYMTVECDMAKISQLRKEWKNRGMKISVNDLIIRAAALSLASCPEVNVRWNEGLETVPKIDISIAVATPAGLITPIIHDANRMSLEEINTRVRELSEKARQGKLQPHEFQGGSFSISNLGMFGISEFSAVINPPQAAILAVGTTLQGFTENGNVTQIMKATLSYDSRAVDEETVAHFLEILSGFLRNPQSMDKSGADRRLSRLISAS